jgi:hypothetical protein
MSKAIAVQCTAISKQTGNQCKHKAIHGGTVCRYHAGGAQQVKAKAAVRAEWGLGDTTVDPVKYCSGCSRKAQLEQSCTQGCCRKLSMRLSD